MSCFAKSSERNARSDRQEAGKAQTASRAEPIEVIFQISAGERRGPGSCYCESHEHRSAHLAQVAEGIGRGIGNAGRFGKPPEDEGDDRYGTQSLDKSEEERPKPILDGLPSILDPTHDNGGYVNSDEEEPGNALAGPFNGLF